MSLKRNQEFDFWKSVEDSLRSGLWTCAGSPLSQDDQARVANAIVLWGLAIKDCYVDKYPRVVSDAALSSWMVRLKHYDVFDLLENVKSAISLIRDWSPIMGDWSLPHFKRAAREYGVDLLSPVFDPLRAPLYTFAKTYEGFSNLNTCLSFWERLTLHEVEGLAEETLQQYVAQEATMTTWTYPDHLLAQLRAVAFPFGNEYRHGIPDHGNGATAEVRRGRGVARKWKAARHTWRTWQLSQAWDEPLPFNKVETAYQDLAAKIELVPKGINKKRPICLEPSLHQYYQHGIFSGMMKLFSRTPQWHVDLREQSYNRELAMRASQKLDYGTIDLSSASDSVTWPLLRAMLEGTGLWSDLVRCRTRYAELPDKSRLEMTKAFPMGSAVCFPVECLVFSAIVQVAQQRVGVHSYFRVYGDDIVVHRSCFNEVIELLTQLHFTVNDAKTFAPGSWFTESCGIECYGGMDVTPFRLPRRYDVVNIRDVDRHPSALDGVVSVINGLYARGLMSPRAYILHSLLLDHPEVPFSENENGVKSYSVTNYRLENRYRSDYQRSEVYCLRSASSVDRGPSYLRYESLLRQFARTSRSSLLFPEDRIDVAVGPSHNHLEWKWEPTETFVS